MGGPAECAWGATSVESLLVTAAMLAVAFEIEIDVHGSPETLTRMEELSRRLGQATVAARLGEPGDRRAG